MPTRSDAFLRMLRGACCVLGLSACESILGLDDFSLALPSVVAGRSCNVHADCTEPTGQFRCLQQRCATPQTDDCSVAAGPDQDDRAIWIGALLSTSASDAAINR